MTYYPNGILGVEGLKPCPHCGIFKGLSVLALDEGGYMLSYEGYDDYRDCCESMGEEPRDYARYLEEEAESWKVYCSLCGAGVECKHRSDAFYTWNRRDGQ